MAITSTRDKLRLTVGDIDEDAPLFQDDELDFFLSESGDVIDTAALAVCDAAAMKFARAYDFTADGQSFSRSQMRQAYADLAVILRKRVNGGLTTLVPTRVDGYSQDIAADEVGTTTARPRQRYAGGSDFDVP